MPNNEYKRLDDNGLIYMLQLLKNKIDNAGDKNVIETVKVNGTPLVPDANKAVDVAVPHYDSKVNVNSGTFTIGDAANLIEATKSFGIGYIKSQNLISVVWVEHGQAMEAYIPDKSYVDSHAGEANVIETVKVNGTALIPDANKAVDVTVPTEGNEQNPNGYATFGYVADVEGRAVEAQGMAGEAIARAGAIESIIPNGTTQANKLVNEEGVQDAINAAIAGISGIEYQVVQELPAEGEKGVIYLLSNSGTTPDIYDEYIWIEDPDTPASGSYEKIGTTAVDLSGYVQASEMHALTNAEIDAIFDQVWT